MTILQSGLVSRYNPLNALHRYGCMAAVWILVLARVQLFGGTSSRDIVTGAEIRKLQTLEQNWTDEEATRFYNAAQGSKLVPYMWFLHLEMVNSQKLFRDSDHMQMLGYLPRHASPSGNADGLPVGFVKDGDHLGLTCAACHTGQISFKGSAWLIDGAPTRGDVARLQLELVQTLQQTCDDDTKFGRFATAVLGNSAASEATAHLRNQLRLVLATRKGYNDRNLPGPNATMFGPGNQRNGGQCAKLDSGAGKNAQSIGRDPRRLWPGSNGRAFHYEVFARFLS